MTNKTWLPRYHIVRAIRFADLRESLNVKADFHSVEKVARSTFCDHFLFKWV